MGPVNLRTLHHERPLRTARAPLRRPPYYKWRDPSITNGESPLLRWRVPSITMASPLHYDGETPPLRWRDPSITNGESPPLRWRVPSITMARALHYEWRDLLRT